MKKARIRKGAWVGQDFTQKHWPIGDAESSLVFEIKDIGGGRFKCTAPGFGAEEAYDKGALYVERRDLMWAPTATMEDLVVIGQGFLAMLKHLDKETYAYAEDHRPWIKGSSVSAEYRAHVDAIKDALALLREQRMAEILVMMAQHLRIQTTVWALILRGEEEAAKPVQDSETGSRDHTHPETH